MNNIKRIARKRYELVAQTTRPAKTSDPVSLVGLITIFAAVCAFVLDNVTHSHAAIGVLFVLALTLLSNESPKTIVLFAGTASVLLLVNLILLDHAQGVDMVRMEKIIGLVAISGITVGIVRQRILEEKVNALLDRQLNIIPLHAYPEANYAVKPKCVIKEMKEIKERKATPRELKSYVKHRKKSQDMVDPYTRDLVLFIYSRSVKN